jgi:DNA-binding transcriptional LysR family regulator
MELRQLEYFVAVAEEESFTRASDRVHISQPGVSAQVRRLERELGAPLLDRTGRRATLTAAGAAAVGPARAVLAAAEAVRRAVDDVNGLIRGRLIVGMVTGCTITPLFDALAGFRHAHPGVEVALLEDDSARLADGVRDGAIDLALIGTADDAVAGLEMLTIVREPLVGAVPTGHPLPDSARLAELVAHPVLCLPQGTGIRAAFDRACAERGLAPDVVLQASAPDALADLAARGLGVAVLSASMLDGDARLRPVAIADGPVDSALAFVWRAEHSPAVRALRARAREAFGV